MVGETGERRQLPQAPFRILAPGPDQRNEGVTSGVPFLPTIEDFNLINGLSWVCASHSLRQLPSPGSGRGSDRNWYRLIGAIAIVGNLAVLLYFK